ncbi:hypothetical protein [Sphingobacterium daejeonense]|uniref:hypothetical protein n=1 Tax=Sphingobacterium daejeonense TaxID=371142 RepID=UPI003D315445
MIRIWLTYLILIACGIQCEAQSWNDLRKDGKPIFTFTVNDTLDFPVYVVELPVENTKYYAAKLQTNVCNDQVCLPIEVNLFWDLLGNYHHFSKEDKFNFTKFDHQYFDENDYKRLNQILLDSLSPLRDYAVDDLLDKQAKKFSFEIDAVTRPTSPLFSNVTVPGALYTVYTLWHLVNGPIKQKLNEYTSQVYAERNWQNYFASSQVPSYQEYFLKHLSPAEIVRFKEKIIALLFAEDDFIPHYAIDVLQSNVFQDPTEYNPIIERLDHLKPHVITEILNTLSGYNQQTKAILGRFKDSPKASVKQKEIIEKSINYEEQ